MDFVERFLTRGNLTLVALTLFLLMFLALETGAAAQRRFAPAARDGDNSEGLLLSAALALLGLLIAFTFSLAISRYDARRAMVVTEANAIGTAWLRAGLSGDVKNPELQQAIARYTDVRLGLSRGRAAAIVERETTAAQANVWSALERTVPEAPPALVNSLVTAVNEMFDSASARKAERDAKIPAHVLELLVLYAIMSAGIVGYVMNASGRRHLAVTTILFGLLALAITLILDLDRPRRGSILVSQQPMIDVRASMH